MPVAPAAAAGAAGASVANSWLLPTALDICLCCAGTDYQLINCVTRFDHRAARRRLCSPWVEGPLKLFHRAYRGCRQPQLRGVTTSRRWAIVEQLLAPAVRLLETNISCTYKTHKLAGVVIKRAAACAVRRAMARRVAPRYEPLRWQEKQGEGTAQCKPFSGYTHRALQRIRSGRPGIQDGFTNNKSLVGADKVPRDGRVGVCCVVVPTSRSAHAVHRHAILQLRQMRPRDVAVHELGTAGALGIVRACCTRIPPDGVVWP